MNRTIGLILSFMVLMLLALTVITASDQYLGDFSVSGDDLSDTGCSYQLSQNAEYEDLSPKCRPESKQGYYYVNAYQQAARAQSDGGGENP